MMKFWRRIKGNGQGSASRDIGKRLVRQNLQAHMPLQLPTRAFGSRRWWTLNLSLLLLCQYRTWHWYRRRRSRLYRPHLHLSYRMNCPRRSQRLGSMRSLGSMRRKRTSAESVAKAWMVRGCVSLVAAVQMQLTPTAQSLIIAAEPVEILGAGITGPCVRKPARSAICRDSGSSALLVSDDAKPRSQKIYARPPP